MGDLETRVEQIEKKLEIIEELLTKDTESIGVIHKYLHDTGISNAESIEAIADDIHEISEIIAGTNKSGKPKRRRRSFLQ